MYLASNDSNNQTAPGISYDYTDAQNEINANQAYNVRTIGVNCITDTYTEPGVFMDTVITIEQAAAMDQFLEELLKLVFAEGYIKGLGNHSFNPQFKADQWFNNMKNLKENNFDSMIAEAFNIVHSKGS